LGAVAFLDGLLPPLLLPLSAEVLFLDGSSGAVASPTSSSWQSGCWPLSQPGDHSCASFPLVHQVWSPGH